MISSARDGLIYYHIDILCLENLTSNVWEHDIKIGFNLHVLKDEYLENTTRYHETESVFVVYFQMTFD